jgi:hypothetical protein
MPWIHPLTSQAHDLSCTDSSFWFCANSPDPAHLTPPASTSLQLLKSPIRISPCDWLLPHSALTTYLISPCRRWQPALRQTCFTSPPGRSTMNPSGILRCLGAQSSTHYKNNCTRSHPLYCLPCTRRPKAPDRTHRTSPGLRPHPKALPPCLQLVLNCPPKLETAFTDHQCDFCSLLLLAF